jgi:hypothetical protein
MTELHDFEHRVREELTRTVKSLNPPHGAVERAIDAARAQVEPRHLRVRGARHWILPLAAAAAAVVLVAGVALVSHSNLGTAPAGPSPSPQSSATSTPEPSISPSPSVTPNPSGPGTGAAVAPSPTSTGHLAATEKLVIRPVDQVGKPAPGYTVTDLTKDPRNGPNNCGSVGKSFPAAVNANIMWCSPSAPSVAFACWEAATPTHALCMQDPWSSQLTEWTSSVTTTTAPGQPLPMGLLLSDGDHCRIRPGDFQGRPAQQPTEFGYYTCTQDGAIWGPGKDANNTPWEALGTHGIDRSTPMWTVQVGSIDGPLSVRRVITAYYLGTRGS